MLRQLCFLRYSHLFLVCGFLRLLHFNPSLSAWICLCWAFIECGSLFFYFMRTLFLVSTLCVNILNHRNLLYAGGVFIEVLIRREFLALETLLVRDLPCRRPSYLVSLLLCSFLSRRFFDLIWLFLLLDRRQTVLRALWR